MGQSKTKPQDNMCEICGQRPKHVESNGHQHRFCGRKCAASVSQPIACILRGCRETGNRALYSGYCSDAHAKEGIRQGQLAGCSQCKTELPTIGELCVGCERRARAAPRLVELDGKDVLFKSVTDQFLCEWNSPSNTATVKKIYAITNPRDILAKHDSYGKLGASGPGVKELRTFHASQCICDLGVGNAVLCNFQACGICNAVKTSFKGFAFGIPQNVGRYGSGIYSYPNPALADSHATSCTTSPYRVMVACDVFVTSALKKRRTGDSVSDHFWVEASR
ncbi:hypothetical protein FIBSPDRAFT_844086 [Athelia psychrophila]|uniref:PARP catalytic domain-containing protein n=1 Tax=Athelia psychrophila TaxID=1759441 RepID=A0A167UUP9_9AGAM|nr:hypothetical protein FIBSPDRAFT_844086 [Fibularhizoctonia sp. CBS 109695]